MEVRTTFLMEESPPRENTQIFTQDLLTLLALYLYTIFEKSAALKTTARI